MDLDELLDTSAPRATPPTRRLQRELDDLVAACEEAQTTRRGPARVAVVGAALAAVLGLGAVASAAGVLPGWPSFSTSSGQTCAIEISADPLEPGEGEQPVASSLSTAEKDASLAAARSYLEDFDYDAVSRPEAIAWWRGEEDRVIAAQSDPTERQTRLTGDDLEVTAVSHWVVDKLRVHLAAQGLDIRAIDVWIGDTCAR
jgi:hypothetical protein